MADGIDMVPEALPMSRSAEHPIQNQSGEGGIEMFGGDTAYPLKHEPLHSEQKGKGAGGMDWVGEQGLLDRTPVTPYDSKEPSDKGQL
jgi:hypothetical protein